MREFETGATRDTDEDKYDYEGFLSPSVIERYAAYMHQHRKQADGKLRASDNWQKGLPPEQSLKSLWRHMMDVWKIMRGLPAQESKEEALCAIIFNASSMLHEELRVQDGSKRLMTYKEWANETDDLLGRSEKEMQEPSRDVLGEGNCNSCGGTNGEHYGASILR